MTNQIDDDSIEIIEDTPITKKQMKSIVRNSLTDEAFWTVNKTMAKKIGLSEAVFLSDLIAKERYHEKMKELDSKGGFFYTSKKIENELGISEKVKKRIQDKLIFLKLVKIEKKGLPAKNYWYINHDNILNLLTNQNSGSSDQQNGCSSAYQKGGTGHPQKVLTYNNKEYNNIFTNTSKEVFNGSEEPPQSDENKNQPIEPKKNKYLSYWNELENIRQHKNPESKVYKESTKLLKQIQKGVFLRANTIDKDFWDKNKIKDIPYRQTFTDDQIKQGLLNLSKMFIGGYWPEKKDILPKDLPTLIYNKRTGYSFFLKALLSDPVDLKNQIKIKPKYDNIYKMYASFYAEQIKTAKTENALILSVNKLCNRIDNIFTEIGVHYKHTSFSSHFGNIDHMERFYKKHIEFLSKFKRRNIGSLALDSYTWNGFVQDVRDRYGYHIEPSKKEMEMIVRDSNRAAERTKR